MSFSTEQLINATKGKSLSMGGLNVTEIKQYLSENGINNAGARKELELKLLQLIERPVRPARQATEKSARQATEKSARQATEKSARQAAEKSARQAAEKSAPQAAEKSARQATEKSARQAAFDHVGDWTIVKELSTSGNNSRQFKVKSATESEAFMKVIDITDIDFESESEDDTVHHQSLEDIRREIVMHRLAGNLAPEIYEVVETKDRVFIIMEMLDNDDIGTLRNAIEEYPEAKSKFMKEAQQLITELVNRGIFHGDNHQDNIVADIDGDWKLVDFSHARKIDDKFAEDYGVKPGKPSQAMALKLSLMSLKL
jgi:ribosomal protein S20